MRAKQFDLGFLVGSGLARIVPHQDFLDLAQRDFALDRLPVAFLGPQDVLAVAVYVDAEVITAEVQPLDVGEEVLEVRVVDLLAVQERRAVLLNGCPMLDLAGPEILDLLHQDQK